MDEDNYLSEIRHKSVCESNSIRLEKRSITFNARRENFDKVFKKLQTPDLEEFKKLCQLFTREKQKKDLERIHLGLSRGLPFIKIFLDTNGALYSVTGCLSGVNTSRQMQALYCIINLGLGDENHCYKVCKKVGSYLVACMASQNPQIQGYCCWAFGNFCLGNADVCKLMMSQGFEASTVNVLSSESPFALEWAAYSLNFYIKTVPERIIHIFSPNIIKELSIKFNSHKENVPNICWCLFVLSTNKDLCNWLVNYGVVGSALQILYEMAEKNNMDIMVFTALIRLITNCVAVVQTLSVEICYKVDVFVPIIKFSLKSPNIHNEIMQLLANIINCAMLQPITGENVLEDSNLKRQLEPILKQTFASMFLSHKPDFQFNTQS
ncbi:Transmembrane and coiled-coil domain-containing protein 6 [Armadillidium vulgare]|nr:Transmembrane and coiled-coil domain-containing protein 6 [Armadillidium vulgare]